MFKVRLLVFLASAALAYWTMQLMPRVFADKTSAVASMFTRTQSTFRLGSGADIYPRTSLYLDDEPDTTTSTTALPTLIVNEVYLGSLSLDDLRAAPLMDVVADEGNILPPLRHSNVDVLRAANDAADVDNH